MNRLKSFKFMKFLSPILFIAIGSVTSLAQADFLTGEDSEKIQRLLIQGKGEVEREYQKIANAAAHSNFSMDGFNCHLDTNRLQCQIFVTGFVKMSDGKLALKRVTYTLLGLRSSTSRRTTFRFHSLLKTNEEIIPPLGGRSSSGG